MLPASTEPEIPAADGASGESRSIVLFDGVCNLCNASVNFVIDRDPGMRFRFASLQSPVGRELLASVGRELPAPDGPPAPLPDSVVLIESGRMFTQSTAALRIARRLTWPWPMLFALLVIPRPIRDFFYSVVAANRYRWFGKADSCRIGDPDMPERFIS